MSDQEKRDFRSEIKEEIRVNIEADMPALRAAVAEGSYLMSFGAFDIFFIGLAMMTAFGIGASSGRSEPEVTGGFQQVTKDVMISMMLADDSIDDAEIQLIRDIYRQVGGGELSEEDILREVELARLQQSDLDSTLQGVAPLLTDQGKEAVVKAAILVAAADGSFEEQERELIGRIATAIAMSPDHLKACMVELANNEV